MSRSGYTNDDEDGTRNLWRSNVDRTLAGKRGQAFLREMLAALDAMPVKELVTDVILEEGAEEGAVCAIGSVAEPRDVAAIFVQEVAHENDEVGDRWVGDRRVHETPAERWTRMRKWVASHVRNNALAKSVDAFSVTLEAAVSAVSERRWIKPCARCGHSKSTHEGHTHRIGTEPPTHCFQGCGCGAYVARIG